MKAKTKNKPAAKASRPAARKASAKPPAKSAKGTRPAKAADRKVAPKPTRGAKTAVAAKHLKTIKAGPAAKGTAPARPAKTGAAVKPLPKEALRAVRALPPKPSIPRPQLIAQRRKEFAHFRELLLGKQREQIQAYAASKQDSESHLDNGTEDYIDYAVNSYAREFLLSLTEMDRKQLLQIEEALRRIDRGEYGRCQQCGNEIPRKRLEIQPWARHCVTCQDLEEKGLLPQGTYHPGEEEAEGEEEPEVAVEDEFEAEPEVEEPEEEEPVLDDEPLVVDAEDAEE